MKELTSGQEACVAHVSTSCYLVESQRVGKNGARKS
jgi:hypothetical protein